jgi:hypothetical protein
MGPGGFRTDNRLEHGGYFKDRRGSDRFKCKSNFWTLDQKVEQRELALPSATRATFVSPSHRRPRPVERPPPTPCMAAFDSRDRQLRLPTGLRSGACIAASQLLAWLVASPAPSSPIYSQLIVFADSAGPVSTLGHPRLWKQEWDGPRPPVAVVHGGPSSALKEEMCSQIRAGRAH